MLYIKTILCWCWWCRCGGGIFRRKYGI